MTSVNFCHIQLTAVLDEPQGCNLNPCFSPYQDVEL